MKKNKLLYNINEKPKKISEWLLYAIQQLLSVFVATVLISQICGTPTSACLVGACLGTLIYQVITRFKSPMFISSCGATVSAVIGALSIGDGSNYLPVVIGGLIILIVYSIFSLIIKLKGINTLNKIFPPVIIGSVTMVIGLNLAGFINTYTLVQGVHSDIGILVALFTAILIAISSHYFKGFWKTIPFLIGLFGGYILALILTLCNVAPLVDFNVFNNMKLFILPDFSFLHLDFSILSWKLVGKVCLLFVPVSICSLMEHYSDHKVLSNIIGTDLTETPGLSKTLLGDGIASFMGTLICGLPNTSYGESIATVGFSKVASTKVITLAAIMLGLMGFIAPVQAFITSIPACVFGGCAIILYGYIILSGLKTLINNKVNLEDNKNILIVCAILTTGVSGIFLFHEAFAGVALSMIVGVILNLIMKDKNIKEKKDKEDEKI